MTEFVDQPQVRQPVEAAEPARVAAFVVAVRPSERLAECLRSVSATRASVHLTVVCVLQEEELAGGVDRAGLATEVAGVVYARVGANLGWSAGWPSHGRWSTRTTSGWSRTTCWSTRTALSRLSRG